MVTIRPMRAHERGTFLDRVVRTTYADLPAHQRERLSEAAIRYGVTQVVELLMEQGDNVILVAEMAAQANVGQVWLGTARDPYSGERGGYIYDLYVEPPYRGQGVAVALMEAAEKASRARGDMTLGLAVALWNEAARRLYERLGYVPERLTLSKQI